jgi:hypothetical protein
MSLPDILSRYFDAANRFHSADASDCFTRNASVHDENHDYIGREAIRAWVDETSQKYHPKFEVKHIDIKGDQVSLTVIVSGDFPGSPIELDYDITLDDGRISKLVIQ